MAFDWIESHRGLKDHPKTVALAAIWADRKPCVIGHLHELWWWMLEYAPEGVISPSFFPQVVRACEWHGRPDKFWSGLTEVVFVEARDDGSYAVHDWPEYAQRRIERHAKENARKRAWHQQSGRPAGAAPDAPAGRPEGPPGRAAGASPTRAGHRNTPEQPERPDQTGPETTPPTPPSDPPKGGDGSETCPECEMLVDRNGDGHGLSKAPGRLRNCSLDHLRPWEWQARLDAGESAA